GGGVGHDPNQARRALRKGLQRLAPHERLRTAAPYPSPQPAIGGDHCLVARPCRGGRVAADDRGQHAGRAGRGQLGQERDRVVRYSVTPLDLSAAQTLSEVTGMSMFVIPYGASASITALTYAAGEPTVADSPTPFAPRGWCGDGVTVSKHSNRGVSHEVGSR